MMRFLLVISLLIVPFFAAAQYPPASAVVDSSNIRARISANGTLFYTTQSVVPVSLCEFPKGSDFHLMKTAGLWIGGYNSDKELRGRGLVCCDPHKEDWLAGILDEQGMGFPARGWNNVWKVTEKDIRKFHEAYADGRFADIPVSVVRWPGKGNILAKGKDDKDVFPTMVPDREYAPFVDVNRNGIYEPLKGDYPQIEGTVMYWYPFTDFGFGGFSSRLMNVEVHASTWCYQRNTVADNIIFVRYEVRNYGTQVFDSFRMGLWADPSLGFAEDDYAGYDAARGMAYVYNGRAADGSGEPGSYGANPPAAGVLFRGSAGKAQSFVAYNPPHRREPETLEELYRVLSGTFKDGTPIPGGNAYMYDDKPGTGPDDECSQGNEPGNRSFVIGTGPSRFEPGAVQEIRVAFLAAAGAGGCPDMNLDHLGETADTAMALLVKDTSAGPQPDPTLLTLYPNPAKDRVYVAAAVSLDDVQMKVLDITGRRLALPVQRETKRIVFGTATLAPGIYLICLEGGAFHETLKFVKE